MAWDGVRMLSKSIPFKTMCREDVRKRPFQDSLDSEGTEPLVTAAQTPHPG